MSDTVRVALLFDDENLAAPLRQALGEGGAQIVHEGSLSGASRATLLHSDADVLVVNLHDDDDALGMLEEIIDGERPRVVFNDAAASEHLEGWDRARWARHLAAKVLAQADVDPPRPQSAPPLAAAPRATDDDRRVGSSSAAPMTVGEESENLAAELERLLAAERQAPPPSSDTPLPLPAPLALDDGEAMMRSSDALELSATLTDELTGLLADDGGAPLEEQVARGPAQAPPVPAEAMFAWDARPLEPEPAAPTVTSAPGQSSVPAAPPQAIESPRFALDHLQLVALDDEASQPVQRAAAPSEDRAVRQAPAEWGLLDIDAAPSPSTPVVSRVGDLALEQASTLELSAPTVDNATPSLPSGLSLELVSLGESDELPAPNRPAHYEMVLDTEAAALRWLVVLGAAADATPAVAAFLAALPTTLPVLLVHTQHHQDSPALLRELSASSALPVRLASHGSHAARGEVLLVPTGQRLCLRRDGRIELQPAPDAQPSIDESFSMAAQVFGAAALAIVFSGRGNDAVAGAQAVHDRGGRVWVEQGLQASGVDMVSGVQAERLAGFAGTAAQLAARLVEEYAMEIR
jgi:two-component system chemotaxis response regulator CheB/chemosensory pili system protein ChpB (putative protein-glutamate methylesterase)